ncbi:MAG: hypothetical protein FWD08_05195 [Alphaproteobacteria bacterium]|nr:hypothetical protein [Alphaproteobacteria bacterium]
MRKWPARAKFQKSEPKSGTLREGYPDLGSFQNIVMLDKWLKNDLKLAMKRPDEEYPGMLMKRPQTMERLV